MGDDEEGSAPITTVARAVKDADAPSVGPRLTDHARPEPDGRWRPRRRSVLLQESLLDELLVYDPVRREAFTLNRSARAVWVLCDGRRTIVEIAAELAGWTRLPVDALVVDVRASIEAFDTLGLLRPPSST